MEEARQHVRSGVRAPVAYAVLPAGTAQECQSRDVSVTGMRLAMEQVLPAGTQLQLAVALPGVEEPVNAIAEVVWSREERITGKSGQQTSVHAGVRFTEIAPKDQELISGVVAHQLR